MLPRPLSSLITRDVRAEGLICQHCNEILVPFEDLPAEHRDAIGAWAQQYEPVHSVAHWDDRQRRRVASYDDAFENAAKQAEQLLAQAGREIAPTGSCGPSEPKTSSVDTCRNRNACRSASHSSDQ